MGIALEVVYPFFSYCFYSNSHSLYDQWDAQVHVRTGIQPATMPLMILASTAIDTIRQDPETVINTCMGYLPTDSALFWTSEEDRVLLKKQKMTYEPLIRWARRDLNVSLPTSQTMTGKLTIPEETVKYVRSLVEKMVCTM